MNDNDLSTPPSIISLNNNNIKNNINNINIDSILMNKDLKNNNIQSNEKEANNINNSLEIIKDLESFINETFKLIDPKNELEDFRISLNTLRENVLGRKIRISLIGNISVGKSTVLNCIIGENLLPTKETECTIEEL